MKLQTYLTKKKLTQVQFAEIMGVSDQSVRNWISGRKKPTQHFERILEVTGGKVQIKSFYEDEL